MVVQEAPRARPAVRARTGVRQCASRARVGRSRRCCRRCWRPRGVVAAFSRSRRWGWFRPAVAVPLFVVVAAVLVAVGVESGPAVGKTAPWWSVASTGLIAVGFTVFAALSHSEHTIPPAGRRFVRADRLLAGPARHPVLPGAAGRVRAVARGDRFRQPGLLPARRQPLCRSFMTGWPTLLAGAYWAGRLDGPAVAAHESSVAAPSLPSAGLAARLVGPRWAPLAAFAHCGGLAGVAGPRRRRCPSRWRC